MQNGVIAMLSNRINNIIRSIGVGMMIFALSSHLSTFEFASFTIGITLFWFGMIGECMSSKIVENNTKK